MVDIFHLTVALLHPSGLSFCAAKRAALDILPIASSPISSTISKGGEASTTGRTAEERQRKNVTSHSSDQQKASPLSSSSSSAVVDPDNEAASSDLSRRMLANLIAAACGALATAVIESPVELFRHQAQVREITQGRISQPPLSLVNFKRTVTFPPFSLRLVSWS